MSIYNVKDYEHFPPERDLLLEYPHWSHQLTGNSIPNFRSCSPPSIEQALKPLPLLYIQAFPSTSAPPTYLQTTDQCVAHMGDASFIPLPTTTGTLDIDPPILRVASPVFAHDLLASAGHPYSQPKTLCGWSRSFEETPVASSQSIPQFPSMADADFSSCQGYDAWERHMLDGVAEYQTPSDRHSTLPIYSTLPGFKDATQNNSNQTLPTAQAERMRTHALVPSTRHQQEISSSDRSQGGGATGGPQMYKCQWSIDGDRCLNLVHGDRRSIIGHLHEVHGMKPGDEKVPQRCSWYSCTKTINKESIPRHILTVHLKEKAYCTWCGLSFAREDSLKRHLKGVQHKTLGGKERPHRCYPGPEV